MNDVTTPEAEVTEDVTVEDGFEEFEQQVESEEDEDDDAAPEAEQADTPEAGSDEAEADSGPELVEVEIDGWKGKVPARAALREADYTQKTQELAEERRQVAAERERLLSTSQEETQALAQVAIVAAQLKQYDNIDWQAWDQSDPVAANTARWEMTELRRQLGEAQAAYTKAGETKHSLAQQDTATRIEQAEAIAREKIPGWNGDTARATLDHSRTAYGLSNEELMSAISEKPGVILLLHDAWKGRQAAQQTATKKKVEAVQAVKPATVLSGNSGRTAVSPSTKDFAAFEKLASKSR